MSSFEEIKQKIYKELKIDENESINDHFIKAIKKLTKQDKESASETAESINKLCELYFEYNAAFIEDIEKKTKQKKQDHADAAHLKSQTKSILRGLKKTIISYALCEHTLNMNIKQLQAQELSLTKEFGAGDPKARISDKLPRQIAVFCKRREILTETLAIMHKIKDMVIFLDPIFVHLERELAVLLNEKTSRKVLQNFIGELRKKNFQTASEEIKKIYTKDNKAIFKLKKKERKKQWLIIVDAAELTALLVEKTEQKLRGRENKIFLRSWELDLAYEDTDKILRQTKEFIEKYRVPELKVRLKSLKRSKKRLKEIATFDSLITLLEDVQLKMLKPMTTLREVNKFQTQYFKKIEQLAYDSEPAIQQIKIRANEHLKGPDDEEITEDMLSSAEFKT